MAEDSLVDDVERIAGLDDDPVLRNLLITQCYHDLSQKLTVLFGRENANWCNFATWASKTAGRFIRKEQVPERFRATLEQPAFYQEPLESVQRMIGKQMTPANQVTPSVPVFVSQALDRAMHVEPRQRYQTAEQFKNALSAPQAAGYDATMLVKPVAASTQMVPAPSQHGAEAAASPRSVAPPLPQAAPPARTSRQWIP